jgi:hypothetical protein
MKASFDVDAYGRLSINGESYTHQLAVAVFNRETEDCEVTRDITPQTGDLGPFADDPRVGLWDPINPSARRQGLSVLLAVEGCDDLFQLDVHQHKGQTFLTVFELPCVYCASKKKLKP